MLNFLQHKHLITSSTRYLKFTRFCGKQDFLGKRYQSSSTSKTLLAVKEEEQLSSNKQKKSRKARNHEDLTTLGNVQEQNSSQNQQHIYSASVAQPQPSSILTQPKCVKVKVAVSPGNGPPRNKAKKKFLKFPRVAQLDERFSNQNCNLDILYSGYKPLFKTHEFSNKQQRYQDKLLGIPNKSNKTSNAGFTSMDTLLEDKTSDNSPNKQSAQVDINISIDRENSDVTKFPVNFNDLITNFTPFQNHKILALRKYAKFTPWCTSAVNLEWYRDWEILPDSVLKEMKPYQKPQIQAKPIVKSKVTKDLELVPVKDDQSHTKSKLISDYSLNEATNTQSVYDLKLAIYNKEKQKYEKKTKGRKKPILKLMKLKKTLFD